MHSLVSSKQIKFVIKNLTIVKTPGQCGITDKYYYKFKEQKIPVLMQTSIKYKGTERFQST